MDWLDKLHGPNLELGRGRHIRRLSRGDRIEQARIFQHGCCGQSSWRYGTIRRVAAWQVQDHPLEPSIMFKGALSIAIQNFSPVVSSDALPEKIKA